MLAIITVVVIVWSDASQRVLQKCYFPFPCQPPRGQIHPFKIVSYNRTFCLSGKVEYITVGSAPA